MMTESYRKISKLIEQPLHLGLTEAGGLRSGTIKSSIAIGQLLSEGIGDTIRVSLASNPCDEIKVGFDILRSLKLRKKGINFIACPSCARQNFDVIKTMNALESRLEDVTENLDIADVLKKKDVFALSVNGDSMIDACIADGDMVLMEPIKDSNTIKNGTIVSAMVPGLGTTLKYFFKREGKIFLEAANPAYEPIELSSDDVVFQGKLLAVWRKI